MNAHIPLLPAMLPSREVAQSRALETLKSGFPVLVTGDPGSGHTTFGQMLLADRAQDGRFVHRITGSSTLADVPFAALAAIAAQIPGLAMPETSANETTAALAAKSFDTPRTILLDDAEKIDAASAAMIAQLAPNTELIIATNRVTSLAPELQSIAYEHGSFHYELAPLSVDDTRVLVEDLLHETCNASTINRFFNLSSGNPMYLRELVIDAHQQGSLKELNGYLTLDTNWVPSGNRIRDLVTIRLAEQPNETREAVGIIAVTGPLPRTLAKQLIDSSEIDSSIDEGLLTVSSRNHKADIAQIFDGPGAARQIDHPEEMIQLGSGLNSELVLATLAPSVVEKYHDLVLESLDETSLPTATRMHLNAVFAGQSSKINNVIEQNKDKLIQVAERVVGLTHEGKPLDGIELFAENVGGELWADSSAEAQTVFIQSMFLAMIGEGSRLDVFDNHFEIINWHDLSLDHGVFLTGRGDMFLELGNVEEAEQMLAQALGLLSIRDLTGIAGFTAGLDAVAAVMLGDIDRAKTQFETFIKAPVKSGGVARSEVDRLSLIVIRELEGTDAAAEALQSQLEIAEAEGQSFIVMRLLHDAWRLRLFEPEAEQGLLERMAEAASKVQGTFARQLEQYAEAFKELTDARDYDKPIASSPKTIEEVVHGHLETGRALFAAEVAARAAEITTSIADRRRTGTLLTMFAQATQYLIGVNTPSLGRARIDPDLLSEREVEICSGAVAGKTNAEIAADLFLSTRTVEGHLQRAYNKLGITDRRQLLPARDLPES